MLAGGEDGFQARAELILARIVGDRILIDDAVAVGAATAGDLRAGVVQHREQLAGVQFGQVLVGHGVGVLVLRSDGLRLCHGFHSCVEEVELYNN